jgi:hypothetical protein
MLTRVRLNYKQEMVLQLSHKKEMVVLLRKKKEMVTHPLRVQLTRGKSMKKYLVLTVNSCFKVRLDFQADKSPVVVKGPFFPRVVNPRYRIRGTNV